MMMDIKCAASVLAVLPYEWNLKRLSPYNSDGSFVKVPLEGIMTRKDADIK